MFGLSKSGIGARRFGFALGLVSALLVMIPDAHAQSATDIIRKLAPVEDGQSSPPSTAAPAPHSRRGSMFGGSRYRDIEVDFGGKRSRAYIDYRRSVDLTVYFEYDSDQVTPRAQDMLDRLAEALASPQLRGHRFLIAGHTDAVGSDEYNFDLSFRRARAVREYLAQVHGIPPNRIAVKGWGRSRLKDRRDPEAPINRRVEVTLIADYGTSYDEQNPGYSGPAYRRSGYRTWYTCPPGSHLIDPRYPDRNIDDFASGTTSQVCRPD